MKAEEIRKGMIHRDPVTGARVYTVLEEPRVQAPHVVARVLYTDAGTGERIWEIGKDVPLEWPS